MSAASQTASGATPRVSIGLPVYNGERYLRRALESLLRQTRQDFELIISDNASSDSTADICAQYRHDPRVRYFRQPHNVGVARNWNFVAAQARGTYFKWSSASDICAPELLEKCVAAMDADDRVVLCYGRTRLIDENEQELEIYGGDLSITEETPLARFRHLRQLGLNNAQSGVIRLSALRETGLVRVYRGGDIVLMAELALLGHYKLLPDVLLNRRMSRTTFSAMLSPEELNNFWDPTEAVDVESLARMKLHRDHIVAAVRVTRPWTQKLPVFLAALKNLYWDQAAVRAELTNWVQSSSGGRAVAGR